MNEDVMIHHQWMNSVLSFNSISNKGWNKRLDKLLFYNIMPSPACHSIYSLASLFCQPVGLLCLWQPRINNWISVIWNHTQLTPSFDSSFFSQRPYIPPAICARPNGLPVLLPQELWTLNGWIVIDHLCPIAPQRLCILLHLNKLIIYSFH